jgi:hypothetical protein
VGYDREEKRREEKRREAMADIRLEPAADSNLRTKDESLCPEWTATNPLF